VAVVGGASAAVSGVFIELGAKGVMELATHLGIRLDDEMKYIQTNKSMETNVAGIYAAGDICGPPWQMAKAVGEGCVAGVGAATYARKTGNPGPFFFPQQTRSFLPTIHLTLQGTQRDDNCQGVMDIYPFLFLTF